MSVILRTATLAELDLILDWATREGWNPGLDDAAAFHAADPAGFFVAEQNEQPVAAISVVNHDRNIAFLGLYLCLPDWRGRGIGLRLWHHALEHAGGRSVILEGVAAQQGNYAKSGFRKLGETRRWEGVFPDPGQSDVRPVQDDDLSQLLALDAPATGYSRQAFLQAWVQPGKTRRSFIAEDGTGFATARACRDGCKIGPVIAQDAEAALRLASAAAQHFGQTRAIIDVPAQNSAFASVLAELGFDNSFTTARMVRGTPPSPTAPVFATATLELG